MMRFAKPLQFDIKECCFLKYSTIFLHTLSQIGEPLPIFTSDAAVELGGMTKN